jgi:hypothetical protein
LVLGLEARLTAFARIAVCTIKRNCCCFVIYVGLSAHCSMEQFVLQTFRRYPLGFSRWRITEPTSSVIVRARSTMDQRDNIAPGFSFNPGISQGIQQPRLNLRNTRGSDVKRKNATMALSSPHMVSLMIVGSVPPNAPSNWYAAEL